MAGSRIATLCSYALLCGCGVKSDPATTQALDGESLYRQPHADGNTFACATCHALSEPASDGYRRPGHPIGDAATRPNWKNGQVSVFLDAVNSCREEWMGATAFASDDARWQALEGYLRAQAGSAAATAVSFTIVDPPADLMGGDADAGHTTFNLTCIVCHGNDAVGTERAPSLAGTLVDAETIAARVRTSGSATSPVYSGLTGGRMPFWAADRLTDTELVDIVGYLAMTEAVEMPSGASDADSDRVDLSVDGASSACGTSHAKIGQQLTFSTNFHQVAGSASIIDDCTIHLDNFTFDGGGIVVKVYAGNDGNYANGPILSRDFKGEAFNNGQASIRLPQGVGLNDFDGISIWCVAVGVSFGDGQFQ